MSSGKAYGINREYQAVCRDVLIHRHPELVSWESDGVDVAFDLPDTRWTFDVALRAPDNSIVVAECRRTVDPVKQEDVAAFACKVESLRHNVGEPVSAFFFTKTAHQLGAVRVGQHYGVEVALLDEGAVPPGFNLVFLTYDSERERRVRHFIMHVEAGIYQITGNDVKLTCTKAAANRKADAREDNDT